MILKNSPISYVREVVKDDTERLYIFTDNGDRSSGKGLIPDDSEYSIRFGKKNLHFPSRTTALIRGLENAYPVTTQKRFVPGTNSYLGNWKDEDFEEFKKVIDDDFEHIKNACKEKGYEEIIFPQNGVLNGKISKITPDRTPKLFAYIVQKEIELKEFKP
jgi:hypothetical protein